jgi:predicted DsbA family dithiol-disulfide isomerase
MTSQTPLRIDFVSDVACPWCAIGLASLQQALTRLDGTVNAEIHLQPFEVNPQLPPEGEDANERQMGKYGISEEQLEARRAVIRERAAAFGIAFNTHGQPRLWHLRCAPLAALGRAAKRALALALKRILQRAYFSDDENISNHEVLVRLAREAGLDADAARRVLEGGEYADAVRTQERHFQQAGVHSVPTIIINGQHLISGGQPPEVFEQALRQIAGANGA